MFLFFLLIYFAVAGVIYSLLDRRGYTRGFDQKIGASCIAICWPLVALFALPWFLSRATRLVEKIVTRPEKDEEQK